jgi:lysophospholipase L1-like esterase
MKALGILAALGLMACAPATVPAPTTMNVGGRTVAESGGGWRFGWPAIYFEQRFRGTGVTATVETETEIFRLYVDGQDKGVLKPGSPTVKVTGLTNGEHIARLEKLTESQSGGAVFGGFSLQGVPLPTPARAMSIEFIGDSHSVGYGDTSLTRTCTEQEVHDTTDTQQAFGPLVAKRLNAEYRVNAYSGAGVVRNYNGVAPEQNLPILYARQIPGEPNTPANDAGWHPQFIVIKLGANDFSTPVHAGEKWADLPALHADYTRSYSAFLARVMAAQPQAHVILIANDPFWDDVQMVAKNSGRADVHVIRAIEMEATGCNYHPSLKDQRGFADLVEGAIKEFR